MTPTLFTSRYQNKDLAGIECQPVGVSRGNPRFSTDYRYRSMRELAPSREAFAISDPREFEAAYVAGLEEIGLDAIMGKLERIEREAGGLPLVLLCYEDLSKPDQWCHRRMLAQWIRRVANVEVRELRPGDLPERPEAPQKRLFD